ncbi:hypothetical protein GCM10009715_42330 [Paeniglutamicibacter psychrophenolicus]
MFNDSISTLESGVGVCTLVAAFGMEYWSVAEPRPQAARVPSTTVRPSTARRVREDLREQDILMGKLSGKLPGGGTGETGFARGETRVRFQPSLA